MVPNASLDLKNQNHLVVSAGKSHDRLFRLRIHSNSDNSADLWDHVGCSERTTWSVRRSKMAWKLNTVHKDRKSVDSHSHSDSASALIAAMALGGGEDGRRLPSKTGELFEESAEIHDVLSFFRRRGGATTRPFSTGHVTMDAE